MDDEGTRATVGDTGDAYGVPPAPNRDDSVTLAPPPLPPKVLGWRGLLIALVTIWAFSLGSQMVAGIAIGIHAALSGGDFEETFMQPAVIVPLSVLGSLVAVCVGWYFACRRTGASLSDGLAVRAVAPRAIAVGAGLGLVAALAGILLSSGQDTSDSVMGDLVVVETGDGEPRPSLLMLAFAIVIPPFEELYYRGFLYTAFRRLASVKVALPLICVWFGSVHAFQLAGDWLSLGVVVTMGVVWTWLRERYGSMLVSLASHWVYNGALAGFSFVGWSLGL